MRPFRWLLALLALATLVATTPAAAAPARNNVLIVDSSDELPDDMLSEEEVEKIAILQNEAVYTLPISPVSPDDQAVFVASGEDVGFMDLNDGSIRTISPNAFGPFIPLPLVGATSFNWIDERTLGCLGLNFFAESEADLFVVLLIDRITLRIGAAGAPIPVDTSLVSVSPDFTKYFLARLNESEDEGASGRPLESRVQITYPETTARHETNRPVLAAFQNRLEQMQRERPQLARRIELLQQDENDGAMDVTIETLDLLTYDLLSGAVGYITTIPLASSLLGEAWSPDSRRLAFSLVSFYEEEDERPNFDGARLSDIIYRDATGNYPPSQNPLLQGNNTYVVDYATNTTQILRSGGGDAPPLLTAAAWSPDSQTLMVKAWHPARIAGRRYPIYTPQFIERVSYRFYNLNLQETGRFEPLIFSAGLSSNAIGTFLSPDELIFRGIAGTDRHPYYYNRASGEFRNIADRAGSYYNVFPTHRSRQIVFTYTSFTTPPDVYRMGWDGKGLVRLTWQNEELRQYANLAEYPVSFRLSNGQTRVGVLIQAADVPYPPRNRPLIVWQEGGPGVAMNGQWLANVENPYALLPSFGYSLLVVPLSGRPGYTPQVFNALVDRANFGSIDIDELAEITNQAIARGWTSRGRIGITGCSYGGYFTWQSIIRHPDLYAAANPQCALVDTITEWTRGYTALMPHLEGLPPYNNPAEYRADSPAYNASRVRTPVLSFHGSDDFLPVVQNENLHLQLYNRGVTARMVKFIGAGHGLADPEYQLYAAQEQISWFRTYLK